MARFDRTDDELSRAASAPATILLLEKRGDEGRLLKIYLEKLDFAVLHADNAEAALKLWLEFKESISIFLADLSEKEGLTGRDLAKLLAAAKPSLRVINTKPYINFSCDATPQNGVLHNALHPHSLQAFRAMLLASV